LELLADASINLTTITLLAPVLTAENHADLLAHSRRKTKREVEIIVASVRPQSPVATTVRRLPSHPSQRATASGSDSLASQCDLGYRKPAIALAGPARAKAAVVAPLTPERFRVQLTVSRETYERLRRVQDLMRHTLPTADVAVIFDRALTLLLANLEKKKLAAAERPRVARAAPPRSRHVPAAVRRHVWQRDAGRCAFVGSEGRCAETGFLEFHHVVPFADGGATTGENVQLRCRAHNSYEAELWFGPEK
jgi:hypothetical protein